MKTYNAKSLYMFRGTHLLGVAFLVGGMISLIGPYVSEALPATDSSLWTGIAFFIFGAFVVSVRKGILFDFEGRRLKPYQSIMGFKSGDWHGLQAAQEVSIIKHDEEHTMLPNGITPTLSGNVTTYLVILIQAEQPPVLVNEHRKQDKALKEAQLLAEHLSLKLVEFLD